VSIVPAVFAPAAALLGALVGGGVSLAATIYKERMQHRLQRLTAEVARREAVYADFVMSASHLFLSAYTRDDIALNGDEQRLIGLINRMRLFAPKEVLASAEAVLKSIVDIYLKPRVELRQLAIKALAEGPPVDPLLPFSLICRSDLDGLRGSPALIALHNLV
jgi:hypothetical protein